ncbi:MAG TPA: FAD-binding oxidoreductase [Actinomycetota bacterium]|nr:FAD-binding oxidoreductase [Actinomycetota bacterium]
MTKQIVEDGAVEGLRFNFRGDLIRPGEPGYDEARARHNAMFDKRPALIARCTGTADVQAALGFALQAGLPIAIRGGGHSVAGFSSVDDGVVIDLSRMRGVHVDPDAKTVRAQGGALWGDVDRETQVYGLATPGGVVSHTGISGLTLGGGFGILSFKLGLSCDNLVSADVVTADGRVLVASETEHPDLFWGLRGGGGNFGIVTSFEYRLHPVGDVLVSMSMYSPDQGAEMLDFLKGLYVDAPADLAFMGIFLTVPEQPPMPIFPPEILGKKMCAIFAAWIGDPDEGQKAIAPIKAFGKPSFEIALPMPYTMLQTIQDENEPWGSRNYWKSAYLKELSSEAIGVIASRGPTAPAPNSSVLIGRFGGAIAAVGEMDTAFPLRDSGYVVQMDSSWPDPEADDENIAWTRELASALEPHTLDRVYVNFIGDEGSERVEKAYGAERYKRLVALKDAYDPANVFNLNQNIKPSR